LGHCWWWLPGRGFSRRCERQAHSRGRSNPHPH